MIGIDGADTGTQTDATMLRCMNEVFLPAMKHAGLSATQPFLLFVDGHASHLYHATLELLRANHVIVIAYPSHASTWLQAADLGVMASIDKAYSELSSAWITKHPGAIPALAHKVDLMLETMWDLSKRTSVMAGAFALAGMRDGRLDPLHTFSEPAKFAVGGVYRDDDLPRVTASLLQHLFHRNRLIEAPGFTMLVRQDVAAAARIAAHDAIAKQALAAYEVARNANGSAIGKRPDGREVGVIEYVIQRKAVNVAEARRYMFGRVTTTASLTALCDVLLSTVQKRDDDDNDDDERADGDAAADVLFSPRKVRGAAGRVGTFYGALLTSEKVIKVMVAAEALKKASDQKKVIDSATRTATDAEEQSVTDHLKRLAFIGDNDAPRATVAQLTAFCTANSGLVLTVNSGKPVATGNSSLRADKLDVVRRVVDTYGEYTVAADSTHVGHVLCTGYNALRSEPFWKATADRGSDDWLRCTVPGCTTWWCSGCVLLTAGARAGTGKPGSFNAHRVACAAAKTAAEQLAATTPARKRKADAQPADPPRSAPSTTSATSSTSRRTSSQLDTGADVAPPTRTQDAAELPRLLPRPLRPSQQQ